MKKEIKNAIVTGIIVVAIIAGVAMYFTTLERPQINESLNSLQPTNSTLQTNESKFPIAPSLAGIKGYINTSQDGLKNDIKNKVVLYDFWTYSCVNCIRTLPYLNAWNEKYADKGLVIVGIHSPEFEFEKDISNVKMAVEKYHITYPVVLDSDHRTWDAFGNRYWPAEYLTDYQGHIRHVHFGEGDYDQTEKAIQELLDQRAKALDLNASANLPLVNIQPHEFSIQQTPELYFGYSFSLGRNFLGNQEGFHPNEKVTYTLPSKLQRDHFYLEGKWQNQPDSMTEISSSGKIVLPYFAKDVYMVASGSGQDVKVLLDGKDVPSDFAGSDLQNGIVHVSENRLYSIISSQDGSSHTLTLVTKPGFVIYTFTFG